MFADYRVPQILQHLRILSYSPSLVKLLRSHTPLAPGSAEELSIRSASIVAVERVRQVILNLVSRAGSDETSVDRAGDCREDSVSSVLIDFYLWDLAKRAEGSANGVDGVDTVPMLPIHRTRSIWY